MVAVLAAGAVVAGVAPAGAHVCVTPVEVDVGVPSAITVGVPAEVRPVVDVMIEVPAGFELDGARGTPGWDVETEGRSVRYSGGQIPGAHCGYFTITGEATRRGKLVFPVTATDAAGAPTVYGPGRVGAQEVYAGIEASPDGSDGGTDPALVAGIVLVAGGLVAGAVMVLRRRRG